SATIFREGHEMLGAGVVLRTPTGERQPLVGMAEAMPGTDRYAAQVTVGCDGRWQFQVEAWGDSIAHWRHDAGIKVPRGLDVGLMMAEGAILFERAARSLRPNRAVPAGSAGPVGPAGPGGPTGGALRSAACRLEQIAAMGFDVVYLPPVHPIGTTARKGRNNALQAGPGDPGSPWAIGSPDGGHDTIHPELGTLADFDAF